MASSGEERPKWSWEEEEQLAILLSSSALNTQDMCVQRRQDEAGWLQLGWPWQLLTSESSRREVQKGLGQELGQRWSQRSRSALSPDQEILLYKHGGVPEP